MRPRTAHLLLMLVIAGPPLVLGTITVIKGLNSHSELSGLGVVIGGIYLVAATLYALVSSLLVWRLGGSARRVAVLHASTLGAVVALVAVWFLRRFV